MSARSERNHTFDLMRLIFALAVIYGHAPDLTSASSHEILYRITNGKIATHWLAVDGFFLLSGFLIVRSWQFSSSLWSYLQKRLLRIVPGFVVAFFVSTLAVGLLAPGVPHFMAQLVHYPGIKRLLTSLFLLDSPITPPVFPGLALRDPNGSMWTISYEMHCYLLVAIVGVLGLLRKRTVWLALTILFLVGYLLYPSDHVTFHWWSVIIGQPAKAFRLTTFFAVGGCFYLYKEKIPFRWWIALLSFAALAIGTFLLPQPEFLVAIFGAYILFYLASISIKYPAWADKVPDVSYGVYLYGWPVESLWIWFFHSSPWITFVVSALICLPLGWLSWHFIERPMLQFKKSPSAALPGT